MKYRKSHFVFTKSQQNGIFLLVTIILILLVAMVAIHFSPSEEFDSNSNELVKVEAYLDSIKTEKSKPRKDTIYPFNPNYLTDYRAYVVGLSLEEFERIKKFRKEGNWINSAEDFQKVTQVSDSVFQKIEPSLKFPYWVNLKTNSNKKNSYSAKTKNPTKDLNEATQAELEEINGIGATLSKRIINYRTKIGGFVNDIQVKDIYGLPYEAEQNLLNVFTVKNPPVIEKVNINKASVIELSEVIYFDYELAREIIEYRKLHEGISTFEELAKLERFPAYKIDRIKLYVSLN